MTLYVALMFTSQTRGLKPVGETLSEITSEKSRPQLVFLAVKVSLL